MALLKRLQLNSAAALLALVQRTDWTRLVVLHEINSAITRLRECYGMTRFDDGMAGRHR
jgi:hypothetical protein